jgi:hypothetical protein
MDHFERATLVLEVAFLAIAQAKGMAVYWLFFDHCEQTPALSCD